MRKVLGICLVLVVGCDVAHEQPVSELETVEQQELLEPEMVFIKGGTFKMGSPSDESGRDDDEGPVRDVAVSDFHIGMYEVTVAQFSAFVDATGYVTDVEKGSGAYVWTGKKWEQKSGVNWQSPDFSQNDRHPVTCSSWNDATAYCEWLSEQTGKKYRLPTEAEWEYACRAGTTTAWYWGNTDKEAHRYANGTDQSAVREWTPLWSTLPGDDGSAYTATVGSHMPNPWGLYDMAGNVWECCSDWQNRDYYSSGSETNPQGPSTGTYRIVRGGSWGADTGFLRSANRHWGHPSAATNDVGFRVARNP